MRVSLSATILSLATLLACPASSAVAGQPVMPPAPDGYAYEMADECGPACEGQCCEPEQCAAPVGVFNRMCDCDDCGPRWSFTAEALALQRTNTRPQTVLIGVDTQVPNAVDASGLDFPVGFGYQLSAIRHDVLGCCDLELAYFQLDGFEARARMPGPSWIMTDVNGAGMLVDDAEVCYRSALYNGELNVRHQCTDWLTLLAGVRIVELDEHFSSGGTPGDGVAPALAQDGFVSSLFQVNTYNHLYGFQLGAEAEAYNMGGPLQIKALCKAGVFDNLAFQNYRTAELDLVDPVFGAQRDQAAFLGEAGLVATYAVTQRLAFRASATAMWITGVALAPEQLHAVDQRWESATIDTIGSLFYYGGGLGLEYRF